MRYLKVQEVRVTNETSKAMTLKALSVRLLLLLLIGALMLGITVPASVEAAPNGENQSKKAGHHTVVPQPVGPPSLVSTPRPVVTNPKSKKKSPKMQANALDATFTAAVAPTALVSHTSDPRDMKLLVITAINTEPSYLAVSTFLSQLGTPFDTLVASQTSLTDSLLWDGISHGYYQGIILSSGDLLYLDATTNTWITAFDTTEWNTLWNYETMFGIRQVTSYTFPYGFPDTYGLADPTYAYVDTTSTPLQSSLTAAGKQIFSYLNTNSKVAIQYAWNYLATVNPSEAANVTQLLTAPYNGTTYTLAAVKKYSDGRENLAITADNNWFLIHSQLLSYGIINWVTKGLFQGERHVTINAQPDDLFIDDDMWDSRTLTDTTGLTFRMKGSDFTAFNNWQNTLRSRYPLASTLKVEWPFNGEGASGIYNNDTLTPVVKNLKANFNFISHTYTHANLDAIDYATTTSELTQNNNFATTFGLTNYFKDSFVNPDISGLYNPTFAQAAYNFGLRYMISDASRTGWNNPSPNAGFVSQYQNGLLILPRKASSLFYNLRTPAEWVSEYNCYYGPQATCLNGAWKYWNHNLTYQEILNDESNYWLSYLITWNVDGVMFHQPNTGTYDSTHSLLGDLLDATLKKYTAMYNLPVQNLTEHEIGLRMTARMSYNNSGVNATLYPGSKIVLKTVNGATIPVTGLKYTGYETYGGQTISHIAMNANQTITVTLP